ncbi:MAG: DUF599 domain-containing protein [Methylococcales bacterium]|nr:DUF599 domain-containing protein [Methylococcales bacterium]
MSCDLLAFTSSCLLILFYYLYLKRRTRCLPQSSVHNVNAMIRERWIMMIMSSGKQEILAIQTLRNSLMAASFMATTAMLLIIGVLNLGEKIGQWTENLHPLILICRTPSELWQIKLGLLLLIFAIAFYYFSMARRLFNHVGYMINFPFDDGLCQQTCAYLNKAGSYYTFGIRTFFFSLPIILWFFGALFLIFATLSLIAGLAALDRVPSQSVTTKT